MANRFRGEIEAVLDGRSYRLVLDFNAMCELEDMTGRSAAEILQGFDGGTIRFADLRAICLAALKRHHPEMTAPEAGDLLSADMDLPARLIAAAMPDAAGDAIAGKPARVKARASK